MGSLQLSFRRLELLIIMPLLVQALIFVPQQPVVITQLVLLSQAILVVQHHSFLLRPFILEPSLFWTVSADQGQKSKT